MTDLPKIPADRQEKSLSVLLAAMRSGVKLKPKEWEFIRPGCEAALETVQWCAENKAALAEFVKAGGEK